MPNLLRFTTSLRPATRPSKSSPDSRRPEYQRAPVVVDHADPDLGPLRRQVSAIIDAILSGTKPEEAQVREKLRWQVANNPGQPEQALLCHLLSVSVEQPAG